MLAALSDKTGWSTSLLVTITTMAVTIALAFARVSDRVESVGHRQEEMEKKQEATDKRLDDAQEQRTKLELRTQRVEDNYARILETMGEMRGDLRTLKARVK